MDKWFDKIKKTKQPLPSNFDHFLIIKAILMVVESDECMSVAKSIWFIYRNIALFPHAIVTEFLEHLFGSCFIQLFSHWSYTVRQIFHYFVWYVIDFLFYDLKCGIYDTE